MAKNFTRDLFESTYKDDYADSDNYHRVLFNSGRSLQARELTQLQTITQREISRLGRHLFQDGATVNPGGVTTSKVEFIKLDTSINNPTDLTGLIGTQLTADNGAVVEVLRYEPYVNANEPATLFVKYVDTSAVVIPDVLAAAIRVSPGDDLIGGNFTFTAQTTNTTTNPAVGQGLFVHTHPGDFFVKERFVFAPSQTMIVSKYTSDADAIVGFLVTESIVTSNDNEALYDNQGSTPNRSAPGADRYQITLTLSRQDTLDSDQNFVYVAEIRDGAIEQQVSGITSQQYDKLQDAFALRTKEESGDYIVKPFPLILNTNSEDSTKIDLNLGRGVAYVNGYRVSVDATQTTTLDKPRTTRSIRDEAIGAAYGNYILVETTKGLFDFSVFQEIELRGAGASFAGDLIGTARVLGAEFQTGAVYTTIKLYLFAITINPGQNRRDIRFVGIDSNNFASTILTNNQLKFNDTNLNNLLFPLPVTRPASVTGADLTIRRLQSKTTQTNGYIVLDDLSSDVDFGEVYQDYEDFVIVQDGGAIVDPSTVSEQSRSNGGSSLTLDTDLSSGVNVDVYTLIRKQNANARRKELITTTSTITPDPVTGEVSLGQVDIYELISVETTGGANIANRYDLDNGQRDMYYDIGKLKVKSTATAYTSGDVVVEFSYFEHQNDGGYFFAVNSYTGQVDYENIPSYTKRDGEKVKLSDVLDFRSSVNTSGTFGSGATLHEIPDNNSVVEVDVSYYLGKAVKIVINERSQVEVIESEPDLTPKLPSSPTNSFDLYHLRLNPYMINEEDASVTQLTAKRFTMRDIARLEDRLTILEEQTALSLLEIDTANLLVVDETGANRTKSGFFVDNFADHLRSFTIAPDYRAAIDPEKKLLRPWFQQMNVRLLYDADKSEDVLLKGDNVYLNYTVDTYINQNLATEAINVNPFAVIVNRGFMELSPRSDDWVETRWEPRDVVDGGIKIINNAQWNGWMTGWVGREAELAAMAEGNEFASEDTDASTTTFARIGSNRVVERYVGDRLLSSTAIEYMRSRKVNFRAFGMKPNSRVWPFFDNVKVDAWCQAGAWATVSQDVEDYGNKYNNATQYPFNGGPTQLTTNSEGYVSGSFFIPSTENIRFNTGEREFKLLDISVANEEDALSVAKTTFVSSGVLEIKQEEWTSTREVEIVSDTRTRPTGGGGGKGDPLAQTFEITENEGIFVHRVGIRFATKAPSGGAAVGIQIRPTVNGTPDSFRAIPSGTKVLSSGSVLVPGVANPNITQLPVTWFEFDEPIYLQGNGREYAIVLFSDSTDYEVYVAKTEAFLLNSTEQRVTRQPTLGSLFLSQNSTIWEPDQTKDMCFIIQRAVFDTSTVGHLYLKNANVPQELLPTDALLTDSGSSDVFVPLLNHGLTVGDRVFIEGVTGTVGGIQASSINGRREVQAVDGYGFTFTSDSAATTTATGGGDAILTTRNAPMDVAIPMVQTMQPDFTTITPYGRFTTAKSLASDNQVQYSVNLTNYIPIRLSNNNMFSAPAIIASEHFQDSSPTLAGEPSVSIRLDMSTASNRVSPVVDLQRTSITAVCNLIDNPSQTVANNRNVPIEFVSETVPTGGTTLSKHITAPVLLENDAVGIKVLMAVNKPASADIDVYYRVNVGADSADGSLFSTDWTLQAIETPMPYDDNPNVFREYEYLIGGDAGDLDPFDEFQIKIVMRSSNSSKVPSIRDLRAIALSV